MIREISDKRIYKRFEQEQHTDYGGVPIEEFEPYLVDNLSGLVLCPKCLQPHGKLRLRFGEQVEQRCSCEKETESWSESWRGDDFPKAYETCYCCGLEVIHSGTRWSPFYCDDCAKAILRFNTAAGRCLIPLGRHSLMNGIRLNKAAPLKEAVSVFTSDVKLLFKNIDKVDKHRSMILRRQLKTLKLPKNASLLMLTKASFGIDRKQAKAEALLSIISYTLKIPIEEVAKLLLLLDAHAG